MTTLRDWPTVHTVGDVYTQPGFVLGERTIPDYELVYFPEGSDTVYETGGRAHALANACLVFTRPGEPHRYRFDPRKAVRHLFVHFDHPALRSNDSRYAALLRDTDALPADNPLFAGLMTQILRVANRQAEHWKRPLTTLVAAMLEEAADEAERGAEPARVAPPAPIARALAYMEAHLAEPITVEQIAERSGWSREHFTRVFASIYGMTPKRALLERRLRRAEQLMVASDATIKRIAFEVGFGDEHHFSKAFKRLRGMTPTDYIKKCQDPFFRHAETARGRDARYQLDSYVLVNPD